MSYLYSRVADGHIIVDNLSKKCVKIKDTQEIIEFNILNAGRLFPIDVIAVASMGASRGTSVYSSIEGTSKNTKERTYSVAQNIKSSINFRDVIIFNGEVFGKRLIGFLFLIEPNSNQRVLSLL